MIGNVSDSEREARVDKWLSDVSDASRRWKTAKTAQQSAERVVAHLEEIRGRMRGASPELDARMAEAIGANEDTARALAEEALRLSGLESGFYEALQAVKPPEVAEAWRMRCIEGKTWLQCSLALHYNRQHLERLSKRAKVEIYGLIPERYKDDGR